MSLTTSLALCNLSFEVFRFFTCKTDTIMCVLPSSQEYKGRNMPRILIVMAATTPESSWSSCGKTSFPPVKWSIYLCFHLNPTPVEKRRAFHCDTLPWGAIISKPSNKKPFEILFPLSSQCLHLCISWRDTFNEILPSYLIIIYQNWEMCCFAQLYSSKICIDYPIQDKFFKT